MLKDIGLNVPAPQKICDDINCPFHGRLAIRGKLFNGRVVNTKPRSTVVLQKDAPVRFNKFKRYGRGKNSIHAHVPLCIIVKNRDFVITAECRPISKSVSFVVVGVI